MKNLQNLTITPQLLANAMVKALTEPVTKVDCDTFGKVKDGICIGCIAHQAECILAETTIPAESMKGCSRRAEFLGVDAEWLLDFENAIDSLRGGRFASYHFYAPDNLPSLERADLPAITNDSINTPVDIAAWTAWRDGLMEKNNG